MLRILGLAAVIISASTQLWATPPETNLRWEKIVIDKVFRSEGVAVGDVNKDGKLDVLVGDFWYEAPEWKIHPIRRLKDFNDTSKQKGYFGDGIRGYSECMCCWADDVNGDGWVDQIVIGFPGKPAYWYENPKGDGPWKEHVIWHSACNESPQYVDLFGTGQRVLVMGWQPIVKLNAYDNRPYASTRFDVITTENQGQMAWFRPGKDPTQLWEMHPISSPSQPGKEVPGTQKFSHGLGIGDLNGDGRIDVICTGGWWEQPSDGINAKEAWVFHPEKLGEACADMHTMEVNGSGKPDIVCSSAHKFGIWCFQNRGGSFLRQDLFPQLVSETHALHCVDLDGSGQKGLVTGKRFWSHGKNEPGSEAAAMIYWFKPIRGSDGTITFHPQVIDNDSGIGTQFEIKDMDGNGKLDVITSNKKGVFVLLQK